MSIAIPVIVNMLTVLMVVCGVFVGKKSGMLIETSKLVSLVLISIGAYGLAQVLGFKALGLSEEAIASLLFLGIFLLAYILELVTFEVIKKKANDKVLGNQNKKLIKTASKIETKATKKFKKENIKLMKKQADNLVSTHSKVIGAIIGVVLALFISVVTYLPIKTVTSEISQNKGVNLEYTAQGQLDKLVGVSDLFEVTEEDVSED